MAAALFNPVANPAMLMAVSQQQAAATRRARRLHMGNLPPGMGEPVIKELLNTAMKGATLTLPSDPNGDPVNSINMSGDGRFCFVEFRSVLECNNALLLDKMELMTKTIRLSRPNDYVPAPAEMEQAVIPPGISNTNAVAPAVNMSALLGGLGIPSIPAAPPVNIHLSLGLQANPAAQKANALSLTRKARRLHIGNLPPGVGLTAEVLSQFFSAALISANLHEAENTEGEPVLDAMVDGGGKYGFIELRTVAEANSCLALNGIEFGGRALKVERPRDWAPVPMEMMAELSNAGVLGKINKEEMAAANSAMAQATASLNLLTAAQAPPQLAAPPPVAMTRVLMLANMVTEAEMENAQEVHEIKEDAKLECGKYGLVLAVVIPTPATSHLLSKAPHLHPSMVVGKVFVQFAEVSGAAGAQAALHGKKFDGREVQATSFDEVHFAELNQLLA